MKFSLDFHDEQNLGFRPMLMQRDLSFVQDRLGRIEGWLLDGAALMTLALLRAQEQAGISGFAFEIGVFRGKYLSVLYQGTLDAGDRVVGVDTFEWSTQEETLANFTAAFGEHDRLTLFKQSSRTLGTETILEAGGGRKPRFVSVDGDHTADAVHADLILCSTLLGERGIIAIDDFLNPHAIGVSEGAYRFLLGAEGASFKPFAYCQNKLFVCRSEDHAFYLEQAWAFCDEHADLPALAGFHGMLKNGRHWVEQTLLSAKCLIV